MESSPRALQLVKQLEELRQWQRTQHERLIQQQEEQRLNLQKQQDKFCESLGLKSPTPSQNGKDNDFTTIASFKPESAHHYIPPLQAYDNHKNNNTYASPTPRSIDDIPLQKPQSRKSFKTLIQSTLDERQTSDPQIGTQSSQSNKKFSFLKKGQGTARFQPRQCYPTFRQRQTKTSPSQFDLPYPQDKNAKSNVPQIVKEIPANPCPGFPPRKYPDEETTDSSEIEVVHKKERDFQDLAVFELIEKFAELNSSFNFTSSMINNLLENNPQPLFSTQKIFENAPAGANNNEEDLKASKHVHFAREEEWETFQDETENESRLSRPESPNFYEGSNSPDVSCVALQSTPVIRGNVLQFSPPPDKPVNSASHTIWDSFIRPRQENVSEKHYSNPSFPNLEDQEEEKEESTPGAHPDETTLLQGAVLRTKLLSLEREINIFRRENAQMRKTRQQLEEARLKLEKEREKFVKYADNEKRRLMLLVEEKKKKAMKKAPAHLPETESTTPKLQQQLDALKEELRAKETKFFAEQTRLQDKCRGFEIKNRELVDSVSKLSEEEQTLRRKLNSALRPGNAKVPPAKDSPACTSPAEPKIHPEISPEAPKATSNTPAPERVPKSAEKVAEEPTISQTQLADGTTVFFYPNGNRKEVYPDRRGTKITYFNGDVKEKLVDGTTIYLYGQTGTKHTTLPDETEILEFSNGQVEKTEPNGNKEVRYPNGALQRRYANASEECLWPDGTRLWSDGHGHGVFTMPSGQKEIYTPLCKRREYPDGTVKTLYPDGRMETRYPSGRLRMKDQEGHVILDTGNMPVSAAKP